MATTEPSSLDTDDPLAALEAELTEPVSLTCPVCRKVQPTTNAYCERCSADLGLLVSVTLEAQRHRQALYRSVFGGDAVTALGHLDAVTQLTGPTMELAVLRKLARHGTVPLEVVAEAVLDPITAYGPDLPEDALSANTTVDEPNHPLLPPIRDAEQAAYAALLPEPTPEPEPEPEPEPAVADAGLEAAEPDDTNEPDGPLPTLPVAGAPPANHPPVPWLPITVLLVLCTLLGAWFGITIDRRLSERAAAAAPTTVPLD